MTDFIKNLQGYLSCYKNRETFDTVYKTLLFDTQFSTVLHIASSPQLWVSQNRLS